MVIAVREHLGCSKCGDASVWTLGDPAICQKCWEAAQGAQESSQKQVDALTALMVLDGLRESVQCPKCRRTAGYLR